MKNRMLIIIALCIGMLGGAMLQVRGKQSTRPSTEQQIHQRDKEMKDLAKELENYPHGIYVRVVKIIQESVVQIKSQKKPRPASRRGHRSRNRIPFPNGDMFGDLFGKPIPRGPHGGVGSGVIIDQDGHILTNNHVIAGADQIIVTLYDHRQVPAKLVGADPKSDLALIKIDTPGIRPAVLGDSDKLQIGEEVMAFGSPFRLSFSASKGIVSAKNRSKLNMPGGNIYQDFIQTDAAINPGNSGGPLVNMKGEVVGINSAISSSSGGFQGIAFTIPINQAKEILPQLKTGKVVRGWLGVKLNPDEDIVRQFGADSGILVDEVMANTPARKAGLKSGDIIYKIGDVEIEGFEHLRRVVAAVQPNEKVKLYIIRNKKEQVIEVTIGTQPTDMAAGVPYTPEEMTEPDKVGIIPRDLTPELSRQLNTKGPGVLVKEVQIGSVAEKKGIRPDMLIIEVNRKPVHSVAQYKAAVKKANLKNGILLYVRDKTGKQYYNLR